MRRLGSYTTRTGMRIGLLWQPGAFWLGSHWSSRNQRLCTNLLPFLTVWVAFPWGQEP